VAKNRAQARGIMEKLGYGPDNRLAVKVSARNIAPTRDPAVLLVGQLKEIYIDGELEMVDTTNWFPKVLRKDFTVGMVVSENGLDDPDQNFYENYTCGAARNYGGYCNQEVDALIDRQSIETDPEKRRLLVWEIERKLIEDDVRPVLFHPRAAVCNQPWVKGMTQMVNGIYNGSRFEDVWLDK
jgi:peptide/nickel transport system substrate-binding protein